MPQNGTHENTKLVVPDVIPEGFRTTSSASIAWAVQRTLRLLYTRIEAPSEPVTDLIPLDEARNAEIYARYAAGERAVVLAAEYGISLQRIYVLIRRYQDPK